MAHVVVLRYGHRFYRDQRVTTHCCLVARAFGAERIIIIGEEDNSIINGIKKVNKNWGGSFEVEFADSWREQMRILKEKGFKIVHLTMYGKPIQHCIEEIRSNKKVAVVIGSQKVEIDVYKESDYNIAITKQPHSEIAALAVFLDWYFNGSELDKKFRGAKIVLSEKNEKGKKRT